MLLTTVLYEGYSTELVRIEKKKKEIEKVLSFLTNCDLNSSLKLSLISMKVLVKYQKTTTKKLVFDFKNTQDLAHPSAVRPAF